MSIGRKTKRAVNPTRHIVVGMLSNFLFYEVDGGKWSTDGCKTLWTENGQTQCACDHLTNFALLMVMLVPRSVEFLKTSLYCQNLNGPNRETCLSKPHQIALSLVSYIGCGLSLLGLLLLILTCIIFPLVLNQRSPPLQCLMIFLQKATS